MWKSSPYPTMLAERVVVDEEPIVVTTVAVTRRLQVLGELFLSTEHLVAVPKGKAMEIQIMLLEPVTCAESTVAVSAVAVSLGSLVFSKSKRIVEGTAAAISERLK